MAESHIAGGTGNTAAYNPEQASCVCMQPWGSVIGRTCPVHGYSGSAVKVTCGASTSYSTIGGGTNNWAVR